MFERLSRRWIEFSDGKWRKQEKVRTPSGVIGEIGPSVSCWVHEDVPVTTGKTTQWIDL